MAGYQVRFVGRRVLRTTGRILWVIGITFRYLFVADWRWIFFVVYLGWYLPVIHITTHWKPSSHLVIGMIGTWVLAYVFGFIAQYLARNIKVEYVKRDSKSGSGSA